MKKKKIFIVLAIVVCIGGGTVIYKKMAHKTTHVQSKIVVETPKIQTLVQKVSATGIIQPSTTKEVYVSTVLTVDKVLVQKGDLIKKGQLLMTFNDQTRKDLVLKIKNETLDLSSKTISLKTAVYNQVQAEKTYSVNQKLYKLGGISEDDLTKSENDLATANVNVMKAKNDIETAKAAIQVDEGNLKKTITELRSDTDGVVTDLVAQPNYTVSMQDNKSLASIADLTSLKIQANISEFEISKIKSGQKVVVQSDAFPNKFYGKVTRVSAMANNSSSGNVSDSSVPVEIKFQNKDDLLKPNYNVTLEIITKEAKDAVTVPTVSIYSDEAGSYVFVLDKSGTIVKKSVKTALSSLMDTQVIGLSSTDKVVTTVSDSIKAGVKLATDSYNFIDNETQSSGASTVSGSSASKNTLDKGADTDKKVAKPSKDKNLRRAMRGTR